MKEHARIAVVVSALLSGACLFSPVPGLGTTSSTTQQCSVDSECGAADSSGCTQPVCVGGTCQTTDAPAGTPLSPQPDGLSCKRAVCGGDGGVTEVVDTTVTPFDMPNDCMKPVCNPDGSSTLVPDPNDLPADAQGDCAKPACTPEGQPTTTPDATDLPPTMPGTCTRGACGPNGPTTAPDDTNVPAPTQCDTYTCSNGSAVPAPANVGKVCSSEGFACGKTGSCDTCFVPDAACTDEGPGASSHSSANAYAWGSIGHCDTGGRDWCGALTAGESSWFSYYDDGTGPLCVFDPHWSVSPNAPVTMCVYVDCGSLACPAGAQASTSAAGEAGCCIAAPAGQTTTMATSFCGGGHVQIEVQSKTATCAAYELSFHD